MEIEMPFVMQVTIPDDLSMKMWNVVTKVGYLGATGGIDVKFVQYLMYSASIPRGKRLPITGVDGKWGPQSATCLAGIEKRNHFSPDGSIDIMPPGQVIGSRSHLVYKILAFQIAYLEVKTGQRFVNMLASGLSSTDLESMLMSMPEDNTDMPSDLKFSLIGARDGNLEF